jgi:hypothetical protein
MQLWKTLYATVWLAFFSCILIPRWMGAYAGLPLHGLLGVLLLFLTLANARHLAALPVPARLKRISKATAGIAVFQLLMGLGLGIVTHVAPNLLFVSAAVRVAHVVCALAILAQASSVATAYDMWEEKEFQNGFSPAKDPSEGSRKV